MMKQGKKFLALLLAVTLLFTAGCGSSDDAGGDHGSTDAAQDGDNSSVSRRIEVQDPSTFLGMLPDSVEELDDNGAVGTSFWLNDECAPLCKEYVDTLLQSEELELLSLDQKTREKSTSELYYLGYTGNADIQQLEGNSEGGPACHVFVDIFYAPSMSAIHLQVLHAGGIEFADFGARGNTDGYASVAYSGGEEDASAPQPFAPMTNGPALPDMSLFLHRECDSDEPDSDGRYIAFRGVPDTYADTLLNELYALLTDSRYHLEPAGYEEAEIKKNVYRYDYLFDYTGMKEIEEVTYERFDEKYALRVMFVHYEEDHHLSIAFHFSDEFVLEDPEVVTSVKNTGVSGTSQTTLDSFNNAGKEESSSGSSGGGSSNGSSSSSGSGGGSSGGGSGGGDYVAPGYDPYIPDASKLQCLTCHGDGDCNSCGGYGYKFKNDIRSDCTRCTGGNCPACGGSGTR